MTVLSGTTSMAPFQKVLEADRILIGGPGQPSEPEAATHLYEEAAGGGSGAAAARLAVLAAVGVARPADWSEALDRLTDAAELGDQPAQGQLAVLANQPVESLQSGGGARWHTLRSQIDLKKLLKAPALRQVKESPAIALIDGLATKAVCSWLISRSEGRLQRGMVGDYQTGQWVPDPIRTGLAAGFGLVDTDLVMVLTQERLARASGLLVHQQEAPHVLSYERGQEYKAHYDFLVPGDPAFEHILAAMGQRVATCLTWLNDDYEGGETDFPKAKFRHRGKTGDAMLFLNVQRDTKKPDPMSLHAGMPPTKGRKYLLSQWIRDRVQPIV
jgi:prolyl 4-hydroxylase